MARKIPPFAAIRAFEAVARNGSLRKAAEEVFITISALSHQVKSLEEYLGVALFVRTGNSGFTLTSEGERYFADVSRNLDDLARATSRIGRIYSDAEIVISLPPSIAELWLLPHMAERPGLLRESNVRIVTSIEPVDMVANNIDVSIYPDLVSSKGIVLHELWPEDVFPVCSPEFAKEHADALTTPQALANCPLIGCDIHPGEWAAWGEQIFDLASLQNSVRLRVPTRALAFEAARAGLGVTLGRTPTVFRPIAQGTLVVPIDSRLRTGRHYWLATSEAACRRKAVANLIEWLVKLAEGERVTTSPLALTKPSARRQPPQGR